MRGTKITFSNGTYEVSLNPTEKRGVIDVIVTYLDPDYLKPKKKQFFIDFKNDIVIQGSISNFLINYYLPLQKSQNGEQK